MPRQRLLQLFPYQCACKGRWSCCWGNKQTIRINTKYGTCLLKYFPKGILLAVWHSIMENKWRKLFFFVFSIEVLVSLSQSRYDNCFFLGKRAVYWIPDIGAVWILLGIEIEGTLLCICTVWTLLVVRTVQIILAWTVSTFFRYKVNRCLARYSPRATTTNQPTKWTSKAYMCSR